MGGSNGCSPVRERTFMSSCALLVAAGWKYVLSRIGHSLRSLVHDRPVSQGRSPGRFDTVCQINRRSRAHAANRKPVDSCSAAHLICELNVYTNV